MEVAQAEADQMRELIDRGHTADYADAADLIDHSQSDQPELRELDPDTKKQIGVLWEKLVLGHAEAPPDVSELTPDKLKQWMYDSLMTEVDQLIEEWEVNRHPEQLTEIQAANGPARTDAERKYLLTVAEEIYALRNRMTPGESSWNSWPSSMRADKRMNCVGSTLVVQSLLRQSGIKHYTANPTHHTDTVVQLANGEMWYFDPLNGSTQVRRIEPVEHVMAGSRVLEINDPTIDYRYIPIREPRATVASIIGNLNALKHEAVIGHEQDVPLPHSVAAKQYYEAHREAFGDLQLEGLDDTLEPGRRRLRQVPAMQQEEQKIEVMHDDRYDGAARQYLRDLGRDGALVLLGQAKATKSEFTAYLRGEKPALAQASPELQQYAALVRQGFELLKTEHPEFYESQLTSILAWLDALETEKPRP